MNLDDFKFSPPSLSSMHKYPSFNTINASRLSQAPATIESVGNLLLPPGNFPGDGLNPVSGVITSGSNSTQGMPPYTLNGQYVYSPQNQSRPLPSSHVPAIHNIQNQLKAQHPDWSPEKVTKLATDQMKYSLRVQRTSATNHSPWGFQPGLEQHQQQQQPHAQPGGVYFFSNSRGNQEAMNSATNARTPAVPIRQQLLSGTYETGALGIFKETEPVLCIKYTISEDMTKGEQARNKARLSAIVDRPRISGSKRSSVLGFAHGRTGIEAHRNHGTLPLKDRPGFSVPSREVLQKSVTSDTNRPLKKGQRFFCTEFPPCQLSFTKIQHLARHIRKHTGERLFQCHCSRRFSRLDNLRQHAQTAHVNEDIPGDSLAATDIRFQRQIRTDRVRPPNSRSRTNTLGSQGGHSRGHSRNLSASSITSTTSSVRRPCDGRNPYVT